MKRILISSLCANLVLLGVIWRQPLPVAMPVREVRTESGPAVVQSRPRTRRQVVQARAVTPWSRIENRDLRVFMANLRGVRCPEATICDIVTLRVCRAYRARLIAMKTETALKRAENPYLDAAEGRAAVERERELRDEMMTELESSLGKDWTALSSSITGRPTEDYGLDQFLSAEKQARLREITGQFRHELNALERKQAAGGLVADEIDAYRTLQRQRREAMAAVLSPQELEEYLYRKSPAADYVRRNLPEAKNEGEYRAMVKLALEMDMSPVLDSQDSFQQRYGRAPGPDEMTPDGRSRREEFAQRLQNQLGEERIAEQQAEAKARVESEAAARTQEQQEQSRQRLVTLAVDAGVDEPGARRFFDRLKSSEAELRQKFHALEKSLTGTAEEKRRQMEAAMEAELTRLAVETMGEKGRTVVEKMKQGR